MGIAFFRVNKLNVQNAPSPASRPIPQQKRKSDRQAAQQQQQAGNSLDGGPGPGRGGGGDRREEEACDNGIMRRTVTELTVDAC